MPPNLDLPAGYKVRIQALSTADGSAVSGVTVKDFTLTVTDVNNNLPSTLSVANPILIGQTV